MLLQRWSTPTGIAGHPYDVTERSDAAPKVNRTIERVDLGSNEKSLKIPRKAHGKH